MISRNVDDHRDIGLNADWCVSTYRMSSDSYIFDDENGEYSLMTVSEDCGCEDCYTLHFTGSFENCVNYYEEKVK